MVSTAEKRGEKSPDGIKIKVHQGAGDGDPPKRRNAQHLPDGGSAGGRRMLFRGAAHRLLQHEQQWYQHERGGRGHDHGGAPAPVLGDRSTKEKTERSADRNSQHEQRQRSRATLGREQVADPARGCGRGGGFSHADAQAGKYEKRKTIDPARTGGKQGPYE